MSAMSRQLVLYIHPEKGPVSPMMIDLIAIEEQALRQPNDPSVRNRARAQAIAEQIRRKFPQVQTDGKMENLLAIVGNSSRYVEYGGVVIQLHGRIEGGGGGPATTGASLDEMKAAAQSLADMTRNYEEAQRQLNAARLELRNQKANAETWQRQVEAAQETQQQLGNENARWRQEALSAQDHLRELQEATTTAQRRIGELEVALAQGKAQTPRADDATREEVLRLKADLTRAKNVERDLRAQVAEHEQTIAELRQHLQGTPMPQPDLGILPP